MTEEDSMSLNLDFDSEEAETSIKAGIDAGIKKGLKKGAAEEMAPLAQKAGEMAIKHIMGKSPIDDTLNTVRKTVELQALQDTLANMKNRNVDVNQQQVQPQQNLMNTLAQLSQYGIDTKEFVSKIGTNNLLAMLNPNLAPMLSMLNQNQQQNPNQQQGNDMTPLLLALMNKPQQQQQPQQNSGGNNALITMMGTMMQQSQQNFQNLMELQQQNAQLQQQNLMERMSPLMQQPPSFADQLQKMRAQFTGLKEIGMMGNNHQKGDREIDLDFEAKKMAMGIERDKIDFQRQMQLAAQNNENKKEETSMYMKMLETGQNIIKNLKLEISPKKLGIKPMTEEEDKPIEQTPVEEEGETLTDKISSRISDMLRIPTNPK